MCVCVFVCVCVCVCVCELVCKLRALSHMLSKTLSPKAFKNEFANLSCYNSISALSVSVCVYIHKRMKYVYTVFLVFAHSTMWIFDITSILYVREVHHYISNVIITQANVTLFVDVSTFLQGILYKNSV